MFSFMKPLLELGNKEPLTQENLLPLDESDSASHIYKLYKLYWKKYKGSKHALFWTYFYAYGTPFLYAGLLKLFHDSCLFIGPMLLNRYIRCTLTMVINVCVRIILHLNSNESIYVGYHCVLGFFVVNVVMSLCLRQYFWCVAPLPRYFLLLILAQVVFSRWHASSLLCHHFCVS